MSGDRLYGMLPAVYRQRDLEQGEPLRALLAAMEEQLIAIEDDIEGLYDNWFIETCAEWVAPYIGDLMGVRAGSAALKLRPFVANTLAYRRRKGTAAVLQQLARDVTGWPAKAVEFFQLLATTQNLHHLRPQNVRTWDLRDTNSWELLNGPFERAAHAVDVRRIAIRRGKYNIPNVGLFLWRLESYPIRQASARAITTPPDASPAWRFSFHPLGIDAPLFNQPRTETPITEAVEEIHVPVPLRRGPLSIPSSPWFGAEPVFEVFVDNNPDSIPADKVQICNLTEWRRPTKPDLRVAVDPVLGRLAFPASSVPASAQVSYSYGFSADVGGGPYNRFESAAAALAGKTTWQIGVSKQIAPVPNQIVATLGEAVQRWNAQPAGSVGVIAILDSRTYPESLTGANKIEMPEGSQLLIVAAEGRRPHLAGELSVTGAGKGALAIDGLLIEGTVHVLRGNLGALRLAHCTIAPGFGALVVGDSADPKQRNSLLEITIDHAVTGAVRLLAPVPKLRILDSIVDAAGAAAAIAAPRSAGSCERTTVLGATTVRSIEASNSIFTGRLQAERRQTGCVRFSYVAPGSRTPRCFRCQTGTPARVTPSFTSTRYGDPGYCQLSLSTADEIRTGAEDGSEMGVFSSLKQPQRESALRSTLEEYLRVGIEAGIFFAT